LLRMRRSLSSVGTPVRITSGLANSYGSLALSVHARLETVKAHECYHCGRWIDEGEAHDCWTTTEAALTQDLSEDLKDAWERLRETAVEFGDQRVYASHSSIMFSRTSCYFFVRPKKHFLEVCVFLGRALKAAQVKRVVRSSKTKLAHLIHIRHRDEVEPPLTDWLREAYELQDARPPKRRAPVRSSRRA
jgi:uncharacterized protein DUF5655